MDYYSTLGISKNATQDEIKRAYRSLAGKHHPDRGGDTKKFQEIEEAYRILSDPKTRQEYDNPNPFRGSQQFHGQGDPIFEQFFHQFGPDIGSFFGRRTMRNRDINLSTQISLEDVFFGKTIIASYRLGQVEKSFEVKIPRGIHDGTTLRIAGAGDQSYVQLPPGNALLTVHILPHHKFIRNGNDIVEKVSISVWEAILGKEINITTIDGKQLTVKVNEGTQHGSTLRVPNYGMPDFQSPHIRGNHMVIIDIQIPTDLTEYQKNTIRSFLS